MNLIKVTKAGLKEETEGILKKISSDVRQIGEVYTFLPLPGKLLQFLSILKDNNIHYTFTK